MPPAPDDQDPLAAMTANPELLAATPHAFWQGVVTSSERAAGFDDQEALLERWTAEALAPLRRPLIRLAQTASDEAGARALVDGLDALLLCDDPATALELIHRTGVLALVLPEVEALVGFHRSCASHHKDLWDHTRRVIRGMPRDADLRWAALLHDIGKIGTRIVERPGIVTFWHHEAVGAWLTQGIMRRLEMPTERAERIAFVVAQHGRVNAYEPSWSDRAVRRLVRDMGDRMGDVLAFSNADFTTKRPALRSRIRRQLRDLEERVQRLAEEDCAPTLPSGFGGVVRDALGLEGARLGQALAWLRTELVAGKVANRPEALLEHMASGPPTDS